MSFLGSVRYVCFRVLSFTITRSKVLFVLYVLVHLFNPMSARCFLDSPIASDLSEPFSIDAFFYKLTRRTDDRRYSSIYAKPETRSGRVAVVDYRHRWVATAP